MSHARSESGDRQAGIGRVGRRRFSPATTPRLGECRRAGRLCDRWRRLDRRAASSRCLQCRGQWRAGRGDDLRISGNANDRLIEEATEARYPRTAYTYDSGRVFGTPKSVQPAGLLRLRRLKSARSKSAGVIALRPARLAAAPSRAADTVLDDAALHEIGAFRLPLPPERRRCSSAPLCDLRRRRRRPRDRGSRSRAHGGECERHLQIQHHAHREYHAGAAAVTVHRVASLGATASAQVTVARRQGGVSRRRDLSLRLDLGA